MSEKVDSPDDVDEIDEIDEINEKKDVSEKKTKQKQKKKPIKDEEEELADDDADAEDVDVDETDGRRNKRSILVEEEVPDVEAAVDQKIKKPANSFAAKKTVAQGMMDIALITANANQLRYMVEYNQHSSTFYVNVILISVSLILQLAIGMTLIYKTWLYMQGRSKQPAAKKLNIYVTAGVFAITIINVFIASFTVTGPPPAANDT